MAGRSSFQRSSVSRDPAHSDRLKMQRNIQVFCRDGKEILRHGLLRVRVEIAAHGCRNVSQLIRRKARASAKHHVLLSVGHSRKSRWRLVRPDLIVHDRGHYGGQCVTDNNDTETIRQCTPYEPRTLVWFRECRIRRVPEQQGCYAGG